MPADDVTPRLGDRALFGSLQARAYLNHAAMSPLSDPVRRAMAETAEAMADGSSGFAHCLAQRERVRSKLSDLLGCDSDDLALVPNTMYGVSLVATSLRLRPGDRILAFAGEYPTNVTPWQRVAQRASAELELLPVSDFAQPGGADFARLTQALQRGGVRVVAASAVQFQTGLRMPLAEISRLCHAHGAELAVDAVQGLGAVPLDVRALGIDYLASGSHKWLMGADGAGVLYVHPDKLRALRPLVCGNMSHEGALDMLLLGPSHLRYDRPLRADARVFEGGMLSSGSLASLDASLSLLLALGTDAIHAHVQQYLDALEPALCARGFVSLRTRDPARRSCTLSLQTPPAVSVVTLCAELMTRGVVASCPDGLLRLSPHWPNGLAEVPFVLDAVDDALSCMPSV